MQEEFITLTIVFILALISPGPDFIVTVKESLLQNSKAGSICALGIGLGLAIHVLYCICGLALIVSESILIFNIIKLLGAFYLIYIGIKALKSKGTEMKELLIKRNAKKRSLAASFKTGFLTNILNPKATLFMISLFSLAIKDTTPIYAQALYGLWMIFLAVSWFIFVSFCFSNAYVKGFFFKFNKYIDKTLGTILILLGLKLAFMRR